jgi:hypothetical protein
LRRVAISFALLLTLASRADAAVFSCDEPGVLAALAAGGGPHTFSCGGPTTVVTSAELVITQSVELDGGGLLTLSGGHAHRVIRLPLSSTVDVSLRNLVVRDGRSLVSSYLEPGGCIRTSARLTLDHVEIHGCEGGSGGAIAIENVAMTMIDSTLHGNRGGGAIYQYPDNASSHLLTITRSRIRDNLNEGLILSGWSVITDSTIAGNVATGIAVGGNFTGYAVISRSTISHNGGFGGLVVSSGFADVDDSTFVGNLPVAIRDRRFVTPPSDINNVVVRNSTIVGNAGTGASTIVIDPRPPPAPGQLGWFYVSVENSIVSGRGFTLSKGGNLFAGMGTSCFPQQPSDRCVATADLNLGKLGPHGGPTWTVPLKSPSVAIDAAAACTSATDQRGVARPQGAACDAGAFEYDGPAPGQVPALPPLGIALLAAALLALARPKRA